MQLILCVRILGAAVCGAIIGSEREKLGRTAGLRTHILVAVTSCLVMGISKYGFADVVGDYIRSDPGRLAAGVISSIGFLGTGIIFVHRREVIGMSTAAGLLATVAVGLAIGCGMYTVGIFSAVLVVAIEKLLCHPHYLTRKHREIRKITVHIEGGDLDHLVRELKARDIEVVGIRAAKVPGSPAKKPAKSVPENPGSAGDIPIDAVITVGFPPDYTPGDILRLLREVPEITEAEN
jgi:putative Mg2+ transporter-C (MgtC) family protein